MAVYCNGEVVSSGVTEGQEARWCRASSTMVREYGLYSEGKRTAQQGCKQGVTASTLSFKSLV